jgi:hypothetical protein
LFNINVDTKTLRKIKQAEKKAKETEDKIKKQSEANRRENRRPQNAFPIQGMPPMGLGLPPNLANLPIGLGPNIVMPSNNLPPGLGLGPNAPLGQLPLGPMGGFSGVSMKPPGAINPNGPGFNPNAGESIRQRIKHIIRDKANFINSNQDSTKRLLSEPLKFLIE